MGRPPKFDDDAVIDRATDLFWRDGSDSVSIRDLERALDLKAPSIYRRFDSKEQLLIACLGRYVDRQIGRRIRHLLDDAADPVDGLRAFFDSVLTAHPGEPDLRGCLLTNTAGGASASSPLVRSEVDRGLGTIEAAFRREISRAIDVGRIDADTDPAAAARALLMSFQGLLVLVRAGVGDPARAVDATFTMLTSASPGR